MTARLSALLPAAVAVAVAIAGCGISDPYQATTRTTTTTTTAAASTPSAAADAGDPAPERGGRIPPGAQAAQGKLAGDAALATPRAALERYANLYINWDAAQLPAVQRELAGISLGQARAQAQLAAAGAARDSLLAHSHVHNRGDVIAIAKGERDRQRRARRERQVGDRHPRADHRPRRLRRAAGHHARHLRPVEQQHRRVGRKPMAGAELSHRPGIALDASRVMRVSCDGVSPGAAVGQGVEAKVVGGSGRFAGPGSGFHLMKVGLHRMQVEDRGSPPPLEAVRDERARTALALVFGVGVRPLRMEEAVFEAVLAGWARQQSARHLSEGTKRHGAAIVRRFQTETGLWPWQWCSLHVDEWLEDLATPPKRRAVSTLRSYQATLRGFLDYLIDERYPWVAICETEFGPRPVQIIDERNAIAHVVEYEGRPGRRPLTREELVMFFDHCDARVSDRRARHRKGALAAFRDAALFKTIYAWGLRRQEAARLDVTDFSANPHRPSFGSFGAVSVRYGKASRGSAPKRRNVLSVFDWSVEVIEQYIEEVRPLYGPDGTLACG